jgi:hypothetical protein
MKYPLDSTLYFINQYLIKLNDSHSKSKFNIFKYLNAFEFIVIINFVSIETRIKYLFLE